MKTPHKISILATLNRTRHFAKRSISMVAMIGTIVIASIQGQAGNYAINGNFEKTGTNATVITTGLIEDSHGNVKKATFESEGYLVQQIIHDTAGGSNGALMVSIPATRHCHANSGNHGLFIEHHNIVGGSRVRVEFDAKWIDGPSKYLNVKRPWSPNHDLKARQKLTKKWASYSADFDYASDGVHILFSFAPDGKKPWPNASLGGAFLIDNIKITVLD